MEPAIKKRRKLVNTILLLALLVLFDSKLYAKEQIEDDVSKQQETTLAEDLGLLERQEAMEYTEEDLKLLATVMYAEAGICDDAELYRVANVVINRVNDKGTLFEDTIKKVIYQDGQFSSVGGPAWNRGPTEREMKIAKDVLEGARIFPEEVVWFSKAHRYGIKYFTSEWHVFSSLEKEEE